MAINERLRLIIESTADATGFKQTESNLKRLDKSAADTVLALQAIGRAAQQAGEFLAEAGREEGIRIEFRRMAEQAGLTGSEVLKAMESVAQGTISAQRQMQAANKLFLANMDLTADQIGQLMAIARDRARGMGISVEKAFGDIIQGVTKSQPLILDNLGIIVKMGEASKIMADALGKSVLDLTAQERSMALVNQVLRDNGDAMDRVIGRQDTMADNLARVTTNWENMTNALQAWAAQSPAVAQALEFLNDRLITLSQLLQLGAATIDQQVEYARVLGETRSEELAAAAGTVAFNDAMRTQLEAIGLLEPATATLSEQIRQLALDFTTGGIGARDFADQWEDLLSRVEDPAVLDELVSISQVLGSGAINGEDFFHVIDLITKANTDLGQTTADVNNELQEMTDNFNAALPPMREMAEVTSDLTDLMADQREAMRGLADDRRDSNRKIAGFDDDLQRQLTKTALKGTQRQADIGIRFGDKQEDIALKRGDKLTDLDREIAGARISVHREFWQEIQRINAQGDEAETDAIRARDARALTEARNQEQKQVNSATQSHENEELALEESLREKEFKIETATQRALRDAGIARSRQLRDQQTGELRSIQSQETANRIRRDLQLQSFAFRESDLRAHLDREFAMEIENARRIASGVQQQQSVFRLASPQTAATGQGRSISGGRGRTNVR